jgi:hypothetical protein
MAIGNVQADHAKSPARIKRCPDFAACDRAEQKKSRNFALRAAVQNVATSFRTVCKICAANRRERHQEVMRCRNQLQNVVVAAAKRG